MKENEELLSAVMQELDSFILENKLSYYEVAAYAYNNNKHDWLKILRSKQYGGAYHLICKGFRNKPYSEAFEEYSAAKKAYFERHISDSGTWQD